MCESYANNIGVRLARWERDSDSERATQKKSARDERLCVSVMSSDYRTFVCAMYLLCVALQQHRRLTRRANHHITTATRTNIMNNVSCC